MLKYKIKDRGLKEMKDNLQNVNVDMATALAIHGVDAVHNIENRVKNKFPNRGSALRFDWNIAGDGLSIVLISPSEGLLESVQQAISEIITEELSNMADEIQRDIARAVTS